MAKKAYVRNSENTAWVELASATTDLTNYATKTYADNAASTAVTNLIDAAPASLDTLNELAAALGDDANYASTVTTALGTKAPIASPTFTGTVTTPIIRVTATDDASLSSTGHGLQVGLTSGDNIAIDGNEIMARNNGAAATLYINNDGGSVSVGAGGLTVSGTLFATDIEGNNIGAGSDGNSASNVGYYFIDSATGDYSTYSILTNASYAGIVHRINKYRASDATTDFILCYSNASGTLDLDFQVRGDGRIASDVATITSPADYAEYFEWLDGNPNAEDRVGIPVVLVGNKIVEATEDSEDIIGIVSGRPGFIGDTAWSHWNEKYLIDDFGRRILEDYEVYQWTEVDDKGEVKEIAYDFDDPRLQDIEIPEDHTVVIQQRDKVNPNYDPDVEYVPREHRQEWDPIGLVGKVRMIKGKPVNPRWRKLQDITDTVEEWFIR